MAFSPSSRKTLLNWWGRVGRVVAAAGLTILFLVFLVAARWLDGERIPDTQFREIETVREVAMPAPPPPPPVDPVDPPPPPPPPQLPRLEVQLEQAAPPLRATIERDMDLTMKSASFELEVDPAPIPVPIAAPPSTPRETSTPTPSAPRPALRTSYTAGELDARPRLVNRPAATYPTAMLRKGVREGKVVLEVAISSSGRVTVRRVVASSHPEFSKMAKSFASRARFTVPKKDGRPVTAIYQWPLLLKP